MINNLRISLDKPFLLKIDFSYNVHFEEFSLSFGNKKYSINSVIYFGLKSK